MSDKEERLERVIQKLEQTVLSHESNNGDLTPPLKGEGDTNTKVQARIREIVTKNLAADEDFDGGMAGRNPALGNLQEENRMLQNELSRVEDLLSSSRADRDELAIKYQALSDRVSRVILKCLEDRESSRFNLVKDIMLGLDEVICAG
eukprot:XP_011663940.1 PREDICTED: rootletin isoform X1 [Strongylocentrotus purpuratus]